MTQTKEQKNGAADKRIGVFFDDPDFEGYPFETEEYRVAYHEVAEEVAALGSTLCIVRGQQNYTGKNCFRTGWEFQSGVFTPVASEMHVDVIYDKGHFKPDAKAVLVNAPALDALCTDKWMTYERFERFSPMTELAEKRKDLAAAVENVGTDLLIAKPRYGEEGKGIVAGTANDVVKKMRAFPCVVQAFMDSSAGIPGIVDGKHDLRMITANGKILVSYIRTPPPGKMLANVALGGQEIEVPAEKLPAEAREIFDAVDAAFAGEYPIRIYSVDVARDADGVYRIIELNSKPGLSWKRGGAGYGEYQQGLARALIAACA